MTSTRHVDDSESTPSDDILRRLFPDRKSVLILPDDAQKEEDAAAAATIPELIDRRTGHFSDRRIAILIRPGLYRNLRVPVGYWTQVLGLGETPQDTTLEGSLGVYAVPANTQNHNVGSLDTFWRSAENFATRCEFLPNQEGKWCVPTVATNDDAADAQMLYPVDDLTHPEYGFPPDQVPPSTYSSQYGMLWAVSQAAPLRRIHVHGNLLLSLGNNCASGGFLSNSIIDGYLQLGSQQQFCVRNCETAQKATGGAWSFVLVGCCRKSHNNNNNSSSSSTNLDDVDSILPPPPRPIEWANKGNPMVVDEPITSCRIEKPFLFLSNDEDESKQQQLYLGIPAAKFDSPTGTDHTAMTQRERVPILIDQSQSPVRVFAPYHEFDEIQNAVDEGCHVVFSPGTYHWNQTLHVRGTNQVLLGIGMATIQAPLDGSPTIHVHSSAEGVRLSGLSLEASTVSQYFDGSTLLQWGEPDVASGNSNNPSSIHDLFCFVGGRSLDRNVSVQTMVTIHSNHVIGDNLWLWRADHVQLRPNERPNRPDLSEYHVTQYGECRCDVGLKVYGHHVTIYGLAVEHTYRDMVEWYGSHGNVYFYQSELPYDVSGSVYQNVAGYHVHPTAGHHVAKGIGVYSYFRDHDDVRVRTAVRHDATTGYYENVFTVWLNGYRGIQSVINDKGDPTKETGKPYIVKTYSKDIGGSGYFQMFRIGRWLRGAVSTVLATLFEWMIVPRTKLRTHFDGLARQP
ncbi:hypothetical protein IV203_007665 [Nitzschia inconspicua]|uniref:Uncharacterized protein n=1 Tax=Nitzschia inconspicua TaxID=303405 RepID=A0A9K3KF78_9STRA|nr:hypothetical protein IV203_007665 [Nitzschia inconspicua]